MEYLNKFDLVINYYKDDISMSSKLEKFKKDYYELNKSQQYLAECDWERLKGLEDMIESMYEFIKNNPK